MLVYFRHTVFISGSGVEKEYWVCGKMRQIRLTNKTSLKHSCVSILAQSILLWNKGLPRKETHSVIET